MTDYQNNILAKLEIIKASEIIPKEVRWLWYPYIPFGKVTLLQGDPGDGKICGNSWKKKRWLKTKKIRRSTCLEYIMSLENGPVGIAF